MIQRKEQNQSLQKGTSSQSMKALYQADFSKHLEHLYTTLRQKVIVNCFEKGLKKTFIKKANIKQSEFNNEKAIANASQKLQNQIDKQQVIMKQNFTQSQNIQKVSQQKMNKRNRIKQKKQRISLLVENIVHKLMKKRIQQEKQKFQSNLNANKFEIPVDYDYLNTSQRFKNLRVNLKQREMALRKCQEKIQRQFKSNIFF